MTKRDFGIFLAADCKQKGFGLAMVARNTDIPLWKLESAAQSGYVLGYKEISRITRYMRYRGTQPPFNERSIKMCDICRSTPHLSGCPYYMPPIAHRCSVCGGGIVEGDEYIKIPGEELGRNKDDLLICRECAERHTKYE